MAACGSPDSPDRLYNTIRNQWVRAEFDACREAAGRAAKRFPADSPWHWKFLLLEGETLLAQGKVKDAGPFLAAIPAGLSGGLEARRLLDLSELAMKSGDAPGAQALLAKVRGAAPEAETVWRADLLESSLLARQGRLDDSRALLNRLVATARRAHDAYVEAAALINLSFAYHAESHFDREAALASQALDVASRNGIRRISAGALINIGNALTRLGDFERARQNLDEAAKLAEAIGDYPARLRALGNIGVIYSLQSDFPNAAAAYRRAYEAAADLKNEPEMSLWSANLAAAAVGADRWDEAEKYNEIAATIATRRDDKRRIAFVTINRGLIANARGHRDVGIRLFRKALELASDDPGLQWEIHGEMGLAYARARQFPLARAEYEQALRHIEQARLALDPNFRITLVSRLIRFYQQYVDTLVESGMDEKALQVAEASRARVLAERLGRGDTNAQANPAQLKQLAAATHTVFLSYWVTPRRSYVWRVTGSSIQRFALPGAEELDPIVNAHRRQIEGDPFSVAADGTRLWKMLVEPAMEGIPANSRVLVVPDGSLHRLNFETLKTPDGHYWIESSVLSVAPSLSLLVVEPTSRSARSLLLIGAPVAADPAYPPLPEGDGELDAIQASFPQANSVYRGAKATPAAYKASVPDHFSLIHFAAHAEANVQAPLESAVILSPEGEGYKLYARDAAAIPIHAEVVTLSGCRSAGSRAYAGEGLLGFAWAFLQAGARHVVAGLWDVSDSSTRPLMSAFYRELAAGKNPAEALRAAKLNLLLGQYPKPYHWAPFQIYTRTLQR